MAFKKRSKKEYLKLYYYSKSFNNALDSNSCKKERKILFQLVLFNMQRNHIFERHFIFNKKICNPYTLSKGLLLEVTNNENQIKWIILIPKITWTKCSALKSLVTSQRQTN